MLSVQDICDFNDTGCTVHVYVYAKSQNVLEFEFQYSCKIFLDSIGSVLIRDGSRCQGENPCH